jgi:hypothetical protein
MRGGDVGMLAFAFVVARAQNLFEKADNFGYIELDFHDASPCVEASLGNPLEREKNAFLVIRPEEFTQNFLHYP